jgi:AraC-like DNA-binding protein
MNPDLDTLRRSERAILDKLEHGGCCLEQVAQALGVSERTLQRRLNQCGCGFADLLEAARRRYAETLLRRRELPLVEVALSLGYSEQAAFNRAFKRWTQSTPGAYRSRR